MIKKILTIASEFNGEHVRYQPWRQIYEVGKIFSQRGIEFVIGTNNAEEKSVKGLKILRLDQKKLRILSKTSKEKILQFKPDVILWMGNPLSGTYIKKNSIDNIPIILYISSVHMGWKELKNLTLREIFQSNLLNFFTAFFPLKNLVKNLNHKNISFIIVPNNTIRECLIQLGVSKHKIVKIPLCFESDIELDKLKKIKDKKKPFTVCYLGPSSSIRGTGILLEVIKLLKKDGYNILLNFLLRSPKPDIEKAYFKKICEKKGISENVEIKAGFLTEQVLFQEIANSDIVVIPTKYVWNEPPLAILESMMLGKPVVTSNVCGLPELVSNLGFCTDPNEKSFFNCIKSLIDNPQLLEETGKKGKLFVNSLPGWDEMANSILKTMELACQKQE